MKQRQKIVIVRADLSQAIRDERFGVICNMLRAYRRNAAAYYTHHNKIKGGEGCVCPRCAENERLEGLYPQFVIGD